MVYSPMANQIFMPMQEKFFFDSGSAMLRGRFGTSWVIIHERLPPQSGLWVASAARSTPINILASHLGRS